MGERSAGGKAFRDLDAGKAGQEFSSVRKAVVLESCLKALANNIVADIVEEVRIHPPAGVRQPALPLIM